jgi:hypothetical protein
MTGDVDTPALVALISNAVVARLTAAGFPSLVAGQILLGEQHLAVTDAPPKITFVPATCEYSSKDISGALPLFTNTPYDAERLVQISNKPVLTEEFTFEVHCWATTTDRTDPATIPDADYTFARALAHAVIASVDDLARGVFRCSRGIWTRQGVVTQGREFVFDLTLFTPVLTQLLPFVPPGTVGQATIVPDGSTGDSVVIPLG